MSEQKISNGFALLERGDVSAAIQEAHETIATTPNCAEAYLLLGIALARKEEIDPAIAALQAGEQLQPTAFAFPYNSGILFRATDRHPEAIQEFAKVAAMEHAPAAVLLDIAQYMMSRSEKQKASLALSTLMKADPENKDAQALLHRLNSLSPNFSRSMIKHAEFLDARSRYPAPYIGFTGKPFSLHESGKPLDEWGFPNDAPPPPEKPTDEIRIFIVGDSTMFNGSGPNKETIPDMVQTILRDKGFKNARIYNFGVMSSCAMQMLALLSFRLAELSPDLVIMVCGAAETYVPRAYDPRPGYPYNFYVVEELYSHFFDFSRNIPENKEVDYSEIFAGIAAKQSELRARYGVGKSQEWETLIIEEFQKFLNRLDKTAKAYSIDVTLLLQPLVCTKACLTDGERKTCSSSALEYFKRQYGRYKNLMFPNGSNKNRWGAICLQDITDVFDGQSGTIYTDFVHYNEEGSRLMAERISAVVEKRLSSPFFRIQPLVKRMLACCKRF